MKDNFLIIKDFKHGWHQNLDASRIPLGGAQKSVNTILTDRGGISPRPGEVLLGDSDVTQTGIISMHSFKKTYGADILIKTFSDKIEYYNNVSESWSLLNDGYQSGKVFGFKEHTTDSEALDWLYFGNGVDSYSRWGGYESKITSALVGGETTIPVVTTLLNDTFWEGTASSVTTTTITVPAGTWATDIWNDFYVHITSGAQDTYISKISATTATQITFPAIAGLSGTPTFEIRRVAVDDTGTLVYGTSKIAYTAIPTSVGFTVASADATAIDAGITQQPIEYPEDPRGNILETNVAQMYVAGVKSSKSTVYRSSLNDATDFTFASPRAADEGDVIFFPYDGHSITDMKKQEDRIYVFKRDSIEALTYTQDAADIAQIDPVIQGVNVGTEAKVWRQDNDIAYVTPDKKITTIGRVLDKDFKPQIEDIGINIRRALEGYEFNDVYGEEYNKRAFVCVKSDDTVTENDIMLVNNKQNRSWEGYWQIAASAIVSHNSKLYYGASYSPDVFEMLTGINKIRGEDTFPVEMTWRSGFINKKGSGFYLNEVSSIAVEGYITSGSTIEVNLYKDFATTPFQELRIVGTETQYQDGVPTFSLLGGDPKGLEPLGASSIIGDVEPDGRRHFIIFLDFQITPLEYIAVEVGSSGKNQNFEVDAIGINATDTAFENQERIKNTN